MLGKKWISKNSKVNFKCEPLQEFLMNRWRDGGHLADDGIDIYVGNLTFVGTYIRRFVWKNNFAELFLWYVSEKSKSLSN